MNHDAIVEALLAAARGVVRQRFGVRADQAWPMLEPAVCTVAQELAAAVRPEPTLPVSVSPLAQQTRDKARRLQEEARKAREGVEQFRRTGDESSIWSRDEYEILDELSKVEEEAHLEEKIEAEVNEALKANKFVVRAPSVEEVAEAITTAWNDDVDSDYVRVILETESIFEERYKLYETANEVPGVRLLQILTVEQPERVDDSFLLYLLINLRPVFSFEVPARKSPQKPRREGVRWVNARRADLLSVAQKIVELIRRRRDQELGQIGFAFDEPHPMWTVQGAGAAVRQARERQDRELTERLAREAAQREASEAAER